MVIALYVRRKGGDDMPLYEYRCVDCGTQDQRVAGLDDNTAMCISCEGLMLRLNEDVFQPYFEEVAKPEVRDKASTSTS
jgi:putative FmdB family regulatory protein